jgi:uncharacterized protein with HEPN domain
MSEHRLSDYLEHIRKATAEACSFVEGLTKDAFLDDKRTQNAVVMSIVIIGEAAPRIIERYPTFAAQHPEVPWRSMRGMRNRIAHGYFDINLDVVWETLQSALPQLLQNLPAAPADAADDV